MTDRIKWTPDVSPTWVECPHGEVIGSGTYMNSLEPTGNHPGCWERFQDELEDEANDAYEAMVRDYDRDIREGL